MRKVWGLNLAFSPPKLQNFNISHAFSGWLPLPKQLPPTILLPRRHFLPPSSLFLDLGTVPSPEYICCLLAPLSFIINLITILHQQLILFLSWTRANLHLHQHSLPFLKKPSAHSFLLLTETTPSSMSPQACGYLTVTIIICIAFLLWVTTFRFFMLCSTPFLLK